MLEKIRDLSVRQRIALLIGFTLTIVLIIAVVFTGAGTQKPASTDWTRQEKREILLLAISTLENEEDVEKAINIFLTIGEGREEVLQEMTKNPPEGVDPSEFGSIWSDYKRQQEAAQSAGTFVIVCMSVFLVLFFAGVFFAVRRFAPNPLARSSISPKNISNGSFSETDVKKKPASDEAESARKLEDDKKAAIALFEAEYRYPDDNFDEKYEIVTDDGRYLGEVGVEIADTLRKDSQYKMPIAFLVRLFDKMDIETKTLVVIAPWAYNQPSVRNELNKMGEVEMGDEQLEKYIETVSLRLMIILDETSFPSEGVMPESFYEKFKISLSVAIKG